MVVSLERLRAACRAGRLTAYHRHVADAQRFPWVVYDSGAA
jgi:hypothetical protein